MKPETLRSLGLDGFTAAPSQVFGAIRIVPLVRESPRDDLRMAIRDYREDLTVVDLGGGKNTDHVAYWSYVPHALIVDWSDDGSPAAAFGGHLMKRKRVRPEEFTVGVHKRMVRRHHRSRLRLLPLHVAMEGFLALHFGGPDIAWAEYTASTMARGLDPRAESAVYGFEVTGLDDALRVFEIHERQCGAMLFVADALAAVTITPHPADYAALHRALLVDFYGDLMWQYACMYPQEVGRIDADVRVDSVAELEDLRGLVAEMRRAHAETHGLMAAGVFDRDVRGEKVYSMGPFTLERFVTDLKLGSENHIGECIRRDDGTVEYLKTFRLSAAQTRRAYLLQKLHESKWELEATARELGTTRNQLLLRLDKAGFGYLIKPHILEAARRRR